MQPQLRGICVVLRDVDKYAATNSYDDKKKKKKKKKKKSWITPNNYLKGKSRQ